MKSILTAILILTSVFFSSCKETSSSGESEMKKLKEQLQLQNEQLQLQNEQLQKMRITEEKKDESERLIGKRTYHYEKNLKIVISSGLGGLLQDTRSYNLRWEGIIEKDLGDSLKITLVSVSIVDPKQKDAGYIRGRPQALKKAQDFVGNPWVLKKSEATILQ